MKLRLKREIDRWRGEKQMNADVDSGRNEVSSPGAYGCTGEEIGIPTAPPNLIFTVIKLYS